MVCRAPCLLPERKGKQHWDLLSISHGLFMRAVCRSGNRNISAVRHPDVSGAGLACSLSDGQLWPPHKSGPEPAHQGGGSSRFRLSGPSRSRAKVARPQEGPGPLCSGSALVDLQLPGPGASRLWAYDASQPLASGGWIPGCEGALSECLPQQTEKVPYMGLSLASFPVIPLLAQTLCNTWAIPGSHPQRF